MVAAQTLPAKYPTKFRRKVPRSKNGCFTCRQRRKKCDEVRPRCSGCTRNELDCSWPPGTDLALVRTTESPGQKVLPSGERPQPVSGPLVLLESSPFDVVWSKRWGCFVSPYRAALLTPESNTLLSQYIQQSSVPKEAICRGSVELDGGARRVLTLAYVDDLVMHSILAIGGTHFCTSKRVSPELRSATEYHYTCVIRGVRIALQDIDPSDTDRVLRLLLILLTIVQYEALSCNCLNGGLFPHLRASRQLITWLMQPEYSPQTAQQQLVLSRLVESYAYFILVNMITPYGVVDSRDIPIDDFVTTIPSQGAFDQFTVLSIGCRGLYELIPSISQFGRRRLDEGSISPSDENIAFYTSTRAQITSWVQTEPDAANKLCPRSKLTALGEVYRHSMLIFLETAMRGAEPPDAAFHAKLRSSHLYPLKQLILGHELLGSRVEAVLLWPIVVAGSVVQDKEDRAILLQGMRAASLAGETVNAAGGADLLEMLWADSEAFGPLGLGAIMKRSGLNYCMI